MYKREGAEFGAESEQEASKVIEFKSHDKPAEHVVEHILKEAGSHESPFLLNESELAEAKKELVKLQEQKKGILTDLNKGLRIMSFGKQKAREINKSMSVKNLPGISQKIHRLESNIAFTEASAGPSKLMSKAEFDNLSPHEQSLKILDDAGYESIADARASNPPKDSTLARMIRTASITSSKEGTEESSNVVYVPENVWRGPEKPKPEDLEEDLRKAA